VIFALILLLSGQVRSPVSEFRWNQHTFTLVSPLTVEWHREDKLRIAGMVAKRRWILTLLDLGPLQSDAAMHESNYRKMVTELQQMPEVRHLKLEPIRIGSNGLARSAAEFKWTAENRSRTTRIE
jgi:hypothetical protein